MNRVGRRPEFFLAVEGELNVDRARQTEAAMMESKSPGSRLVLDLSRVPRFDFTGIVVLIDALNKARGRFGAVSILGLNERISQVFAALHAQASEWTSVNQTGMGEGKWTRC